MWTLLLGVAWAADLAVGPTQPFVTLEDAFDVAVDGDRLLVDPGVYVEPSLEVGARSLTVEGAAPGVRIESNAFRRAFTVDGGALTLVAIEVDGLDDVGLIELRNGALVMSGVTVLQMRAPVNGQDAGSIDAEDASVWIEDSVLDGAVAPVKDGGHIYGVRTSVTLHDSVLRAGQADEGGGVYLVDGSLVAERVTFEANGADSSGSAIRTIRSSVQVADGAFLGNDAGDRATVQCDDGALCRLDGVLFEGNAAPTAAMVDASGTALELVSVTGCLTSTSGSLVEIDSSTATFTGVVLTAVDTTGAAVQIDAGSTATLTNNHFVLSSSTPHMIAADGGLVFTNNLVAWVDGTGPAVDARGAFSGGYNLYFDNLGGDVLPGPFVTDLVGIDPLLVAPAPSSCALDALKPQAGSPLIDAGDPSVADEDGGPSDIGAFGGANANGGVDGLDEDGDGFSSPIDCDDDDANVNPQAIEVSCNGIDDDCDPATEDDADEDADAWSVCAGDCDDTAAGVNPGAVEALCNGIDDDCDPATVDGVDADGDGFAECAGDCDDSNAQVSPGLAEVSCNGVDDDCDPVTIDALDADGDGITVCAGDCDDSSAQVAPGLPEVDCNGVDDDCDPATVDAADGDADGVSACDDCDDSNASVAPGLVEVPCNGIDDDCDPTTVDAVDGDGDGVSVCDDCDDTNDRGTTLTMVFFDGDYDGYGVGEPTEMCVVPTNSAPVDGDCDNSDSSVYPGAVEVPYDGIDQDCNGVDLDDLDGDGAPGPTVDCDDNDPERYPGNGDVPDDGIDQDCTGDDVVATLLGGAGWQCGCATASPASAWLLGLLSLFGAARRRR